MLLADAEDSIYEVTVGPKGNQKLFACSLHHANLLASSPHTFMRSENTSKEFCSAATVMFNGFTSTIGKECVMLLLHPWALDTKIKYAFGFIGALLLSMFLELWGEVREACRFHMMKSFGYTERSPKMRKFNNDQIILQSPPVESLSLFREPLNASYTATRKVPKWCHIILAMMFMVHISTA